MLKLWHVVLALLIVEILVVVVSVSVEFSDVSHSQQSQHQNNSSSNSQQVAAPNQRGTDKSPVVVKLLNTGKSDQETTNETARIKNEKKTERWTIALTIAAILVGLLQLGAFIRQAHYMRGTVTEMRIANANAATANATSARALLEGDRPWVGSETIGLLTTAEISKIEVLIKNSGKTPALRTRGNYVGSIRASNDAVPDMLGPLAENAARSVLFPNQQFRYWPFYRRANLTGEELAAIANGTSIVWIVGRSEYEDAGGQHFTTMRYQWDPIAQSWVASGGESHAN
jgi:hypothetical protein